MHTHTFILPLHKRPRQIHYVLFLFFISYFKMTAPFFFFQAIDSIHQVGVYCLALVPANTLPKTPLGGIHLSETKQLFLEGSLHPCNVLMCPHTCVTNLPKPRQKQPGMPWSPALIQLWVGFVCYISINSGSGGAHLRILVSFCSHVLHTMHTPDRTFASQDVFVPWWLGYHSSAETVSTQVVCTEHGCGRGL